jgi:hypothetical protein
MEPLNTPINDDELKHALQQWRAPNAPASLERRVLPSEPWWRWLLTGSIRVPVPALIAAAAVLVAVYAWEANKPPVSCAANETGWTSAAVISCDKQLPL